jgi:2-aminoadipate transaminase
MQWQLARRADRLNPSTIREILKLTERPGIVSLAGGLPSPLAFPVDALRAATDRVLTDQPLQALQYAASEGHAPLREWVAAQLDTQGVRASAAQVLITTGSQQALDLVGKVLIDPGSQVAVESPTYLGALQAFAPYEASFVALDSDDEGPLPRSLADAAGARFAYLLPNFQNPSGRCLGAARRLALVDAAARAGLPIVEDNPYGELWFDNEPPPPLSASAGLGAGDDRAGAIYLGSFSKVLAPGLRLGYLVAPPALYPKLLQAKQAADLHTPGFNQRLVFEVLQGDFLSRHLPALRSRYKAQRDAMAMALNRHLADLGTAADGQPLACRWQVPGGGMFFWLQLPAGLDATALLPQAVAAGMAYVPGAAFYARAPRQDMLRLSFATATPEQIEQAVAALGGVLRQALKAQHGQAQAAA